MHDSSEDNESSYLSKYISNSSPKFRISNHPLVKQIKKVMISQQNTFNQIQQGCSFLQNCISSIQQMIEKVQDRVNQINEYRQTETISNLKNKQNQFIINELKDKIKKFEKNQQNSQIEIKHLKKQLQIVKRQLLAVNNQENSQFAKLRQEFDHLQKVLHQKNNQIQDLNQKITHLVTDKKQDGRKTSQKFKKEKQQQYKLLESKLLELEKQFDVKITSLHQEVLQKNTKIQDLTRQLQNKEKQLSKKQKQFEIKIKSLSKQFQTNQNSTEEDHSSTGNPLSLTFNPSKNSSAFTQPTSSAFELELKLSQQQKLYKELQNQYTSYLTTSNNTQIQLHQQIHQQKFQLQEEKKKFRGEKKKIIQSLQNLASFINKRNFNYFDSDDVEKVVEQIKKIFTKQKQKNEKELNQNKKTEEQQLQRIHQLQRQSRRIRNQSQMQRQQIQSQKQQIQKLLLQKQKDKQKQKQKKTRRQGQSIVNSENKSKKLSLNGSFGDISNSNTGSKIEAQQVINPTQIVEEKYKQVIENLREQIKQKQIHINQLESLQSIDFEKSKQKILNLQTQLADTKNDIKKQERQKKQLLSQLQIKQKDVENIKSTLNQFKEKSQKQKQLLKQQHQQKAKQQQQKITKLKQSKEGAEAKCQQRIMKYNKLKSKLEKLEMYSSQTQKRKDNQIQELIKKNQQFKMDNKLLEEKINIIQTTNGSINVQSNSSKQQGGYNRDLIQQIQMERDRILEQYQTKRRQYLKVKENNEKLQVQKEKIEQERIKQFNQIQKLSSKISQYERQISYLTTQFNQEQLKRQSLTKQIEQICGEKKKSQDQLKQFKDESALKSKQDFQHMKKELENQLQARKKLEKQQPALIQRIKQLCSEVQTMKKNEKQKLKQIQNKWVQKFKQKSHHYHDEVHKLKIEQQKKIKVLEQKINEAAIRQENLINIIHYKNQSITGEVRESMKGDQQIEKMEKAKQQLQKQYQNQSHSTIVQTSDKQCNTDDKHNQFMFCRMASLQIKNTNQKVKKSQLVIQKTHHLTIEKLKCQGESKNASSQFEEKQTIVNIFSEKQNLLEFLKQFYPISLEYLINNSTPYRHEILSRTQPAEQIQTLEIGVNTDAQIYNRLSHSQRRYSQGRLQQGRPSLKSMKKQPLFILQNQLLGSYHESEQNNKSQQFDKNIAYINMQKGDEPFVLQSQALIQQRPRFNIQDNKIQQINLFSNLKPSNLGLQLDDEQNIDDNFEICEQGQSINVGQTALNLQIKQIFNKLRQQLQKVFNGQQISLSMIKILPRQLQDDYNELISYIRQKIDEIKKQNQLSFIMAEVGEGEIQIEQQLEQQLDNQLKTFMNKKVSQDIFTYKKMVQQKQALITSLMNEKTYQQNTINQMTMEKEEIDEEHQNRFMNQCNIYKKQIKQLKNKLDVLQMNFQSLKNVFKNTMEIWVDEIQNQDDLRDNFIIYKKVGKLTQLESTRLNYYIFRYKEIKGITD